jgi:hypothetical protein
VATPKQRIIRSHDRTWDNAKARAHREGRPLSDVINEFLETYGGTESERRRPRSVAADVEPVEVPA